MHTHTKESLIAFEARIAEHWNAGNLPCVTHLCGGNEEQLLSIFADIRPGDWVLSTHRSHYHALLSGVPEAKLEADILAGHSMFAFRKAQMMEGFDPDYDLMWDGANLLSTAILAGQCPIAAGLAWACQPHLHPKAHLAPKVWCFLGDGAEEEGGFYEAALWVETHQLPCTFIIEDNGWQMDTPKSERRAGAAWHPLDHFKCVKRYHYTRTYPHAGTGKKITLKPEAIARFQTAA